MRYTSPWQRPLQNDVLYYLRYFLGTFPIFFTLLPVAILVVIRRNLPAGLLCGSMLFVVLAVHTMAGPKNYKYLHYAMPFFFVLWGVTLVEVWPAVCRLAGAAAARLGELVPTSRRPGRGSTAAVLVLLIGFVLLTNGAYIRSAVFLFIGDQRVQWSIEGWEAAAERFRPELDDVDLVATSNGLFALYYLGRYDVDISPSQVSESSTGKEFGRDVRTGSYAISKPESLALLMDCYRSGLYISDSVWRWRQPHVGVSDEMADFLDSHAEAIDLPKDWMIRAYRWTRPEGQPVPDNCPVLPGH